MQKKCSTGQSTKLHLANCKGFLSPHIGPRYLLQQVNISLVRYGTVDVNFCLVSMGVAMILVWGHRSSSEGAERGLGVGRGSFPLHWG